MKKYLPILILVVFLVVAIPVLRYYRSQGISPGQRAPEFTLNDFDGNAVSLTDLRGQVVMLNFWASWCGPCREEMPDMQRVYDDLKDDGFTILAVSLDQSQDDARKFIDENGFTFLVVMDDAAVADMYEVTGIPKTLIIDRDGIVRQVRVGQLNESSLRQLVEEWL
jgi:peroxiredoxin